MTQRELILREKQIEISEEIISKCLTFKDALRLSKEISGLTDLQICQELDIDPGHWSRIWQSKAHFPEEKIIDFMNLCNNLVPLRWLAIKYNYELQPKKEIIEIENERLKAEKEELEKKLKYFEELIIKVK